MEECGLRGFGGYIYLGSAEGGWDDGGKEVVMSIGTKMGCGVWGFMVCGAWNVCIHGLNSERENRN